MTSFSAHRWPARVWLLFQDRFLWREVRLRWWGLGRVQSPSKLGGRTRWTVRPDSVSEDRYGPTCNKLVVVVVVVVVVIAVDDTLKYLLSVVKASKRQGFQLRVRQGGGEGQDASGWLAVAGHLDVASSTRLWTVACIRWNRYCRVQRKCPTDEGWS